MHGAKCSWRGYRRRLESRYGPNEPAQKNILLNIRSIRQQSPLLYLFIGRPALRWSWQRFIIISLFVRLV